MARSTIRRAWRKNGVRACWKPRARAAARRRRATSGRTRHRGRWCCSSTPTWRCAPTRSAASLVTSPPIRRGVFLSAGGFSERYDRPAIEDIELGYRLKACSFKLRLDKNLQGKHLKKWTLRSLLRSDILARGVPWTELILRDGALVNDLNLQTHNRVSVVTIYVLLLSVCLGLGWPLAWPASAVLSLTLLALNRSLYRFFIARRGWFFALRAVPLHWLYYVYNGVAFAIGLSRHVADRVKRRWPARVRPEWVVFLISATVVLLPSTWAVVGWEPQSDEPHYLLAAHSLARDGDLDVANNYAQNDQWPFYPPALH